VLHRILQNDQVNHKFISLLQISKAAPSALDRRDVKTYTKSYIKKYTIILSRDDTMVAVP
jgi:hypothetical protein